MVVEMASTCELCEIITQLGGDVEALSDKMTKTLSDEIIRILACGSCLHLNANQISYDQTTVGGELDSIMTKISEQEARVPTAEEVLAAIQNMTAEQVDAVRRKLRIK